MKRSVEITIGVPDSLREANEAEGPDPMEDCYCINFIDKDTDSGMTAQGACLCRLRMATEMWLQGATAEEVQAAIGESHEHDESEESEESEE